MPVKPKTPPATDQSSHPPVLADRLGEGDADRERRDCEKAEWLEAARPGIEWEFEHYDKHGPLLARFLPGFAEPDND